LAAALEARAQARLGRRPETKVAIGRAEAVLGGLSAQDRVPSAFGYNEAQLRFHEGNAYTHLHDIRAASAAQDRALALYPASDYLDRALIQLDKASCLACDDDLDTAMGYAADALTCLRDEQRVGLVSVRAREIYEAVPEDRRSLRPVREYGDLLMLSCPVEETEPLCRS
jgi:tetratricopeptide (TPR) repeat protein